MFYVRTGRRVTSGLTAAAWGRLNRPGGLTNRFHGPRLRAYFDGRRVQVHSSPTVFPSFGPSMRAWSAPASSIQ